jgi:hypothetical protein
MHVSVEFDSDKSVEVLKISNFEVIGNETDSIGHKRGALDLFSQVVFKKSR